MSKLKLSSFKLKRRLEGQYARIIQQVIKEAAKNIEGLSEREALLYLRNLANNPKAQKMIELNVAKMLSMLDRVNKSSWREAATEATQSRLIYQSLKSEISGEIAQELSLIIRENARRISSLPYRAAVRASNEAFEAFAAGRRAIDVAKDIAARMPSLSAKQAKLIARTELAKANTALTEVRAKSIGADWYIWRSSKDGRVRSSHSHMEGVLIRWDMPPNPEALKGEKSYFGRYHAGCCPNCRCYAEPLIDGSQLSSSFRVYNGGSIVRMTKGQFYKQYGHVKERLKEAG